MMVLYVFVQHSTCFEYMIDHRSNAHICNTQIQSLKNILDNSSSRFTSLVRDDISSAMSQFLKHRAYSVRSTIEARHANKFNNLSKEIEAS